MTAYDKLLKRFFDVLCSLVGLLVCIPIIVISWIIASVETKSNGFFIQKRVGYLGTIFYVLKIKTMANTNIKRSSITTESSAEITKSGFFFRRTKIDELPQLINVLLGQMSFVGPRPDVQGYADELQGDDRIVLSVRPGITGPASLKYKNEEYTLSKKPDPKAYNDNVIWPDKVAINIEYIKSYSFINDMKYIIQTIK